MLLPFVLAAALGQTIEVPTRLTVVREESALEVSVDQKSKRRQTISAREGGILGVEYQLAVHRRREPFAPLREGVASGTSFDVGTMVLHAQPDGVPVAGVEYAVEVKLVLFETSVPPGHLWKPRAGKFRVLWTGTVSATSR